MSKRIFGGSVQQRRPCCCCSVRGNERELPSSQQICPTPGDGFFTLAKCRAILLCPDFIAAYEDQRFPFRYHFIVRQTQWVLISSRG